MKYICNWISIQNLPTSTVFLVIFDQNDSDGFLDLAVAKSLQSTRMVSDDADDDDDV